MNSHSADRLVACWRACGRWVAVNGPAVCTACSAREPGTCAECAGHGEMIFGDGGYGDDRYTETGWTSKCTACGGTGFDRVWGGEA